MRGALGGVGAASVALALIPLLAWSARGAPSAEALDRALGAEGLRHAALSVRVVDRRSGAVVYARSPERLLIPASNQKLLTAIAALATWGPSHRFATEILAPAQPDEVGAVERLWVRGEGDPAMTSEQWWRLAADLRLLGLREVRGPLILDDGAFDGERWHPSWQPVSARAYHAPVGAVTANYGAFRVRALPGPAPGTPARVTLDPPIPYFDLLSRARTGARNSRASLRVDRIALGEGERVLVSGSLPVGGEDVELYRSVAHPARYAAAVLRQQLEANGIRVRGPFLRGSPPADARLLLSFEGHELSRIVSLFLKNSNNMIGEALVKGLAHRADSSAPGSWPAGLREVRRILTGLGIDLGEARLADGSGLSRDNRLSARILTEALEAADGAFGLGPELVAALPIAGRDGTLRERATAARDGVRAKTGLLTGITGLTGIARNASSRELIFSVLANGYEEGDRAAMDALDGFAAALVHGP